MWLEGGCHCKAVRFEALVADYAIAHSCNCSICDMTGFLHLIVPESGFRMLAGSDRLIEYTFNTGAAKHLFCRVCGVKSFYRPRSNPDGWSVNVRCLTDWRALRLPVEAFDGQNWEANAGALAHLSKTGDLGS